MKECIPLSFQSVRDAINGCARSQLNNKLSSVNARLWRIKPITELEVWRALDGNRT